MEAFFNTAPLYLVVVLLILGFVFLIKGADFFVEGSSSVAKRLKVPSIIIGLTIVAMGTSLPEASVSAVASLNNNNELAVANVIGSNIFNLMIVIGVCAVMMTLAVDKDTIKKDIPFSLVCACALVFLAVVFPGGMVIGRIGGVILLLLFVYYLWNLFMRAKQGRENADELDDDIKILSPVLSIICIIGGCIGIIIGGELCVQSATRIATEAGMSQTLIGLTIVSIGTSLPELCTSFVAAKKGEIDMALGNAIGSNIFNILFVLGISAVISPVSMISENLIDIAILLIFTIIVWAISYKKKSLNKTTGIAMIALYLVYAVYICIR